MNRPDVNYLSPEWARVEEWVATELQESYKRLAGINTTPAETEQLRGRIALLNQFLSFASIPTAANYEAAFKRTI